jgi:hypothetical protein
MQEIWANLLANATDPRKQNPVSPAFPRVLPELGPRDAKFLDALYEDSIVRLPGNPPWKGPEDVAHSRETLRDVYWSAGLSTRRLAFLNDGDGRDNPEELERQQGEFRMTMDVLTRNNLIQATASLQRRAGFDVPGDQLSQVFQLTAFGCAFVKACRPPTGKCDGLPKV